METNAYRVFDRGAFVDALLDWGFTGPKERRPVWIDSPEAAAVCLKQRAEYALQVEARSQGWQVRRVLVGEDVRALPDGRLAVSVALTLRDGTEHSFEYEGNARGDGQLLRVRDA